MPQAMDSAIRQGLALVPPQMNTQSARVMLHAINLQENPTLLEQQVGGPARGPYQFEKGGGVHGVLTHGAVKEWAEAACRARNVMPDEDAVYRAIGTDWILASALARLLLWTDSKPMPGIGEAVAAWEMYLRVWRPGAAKRDPEGLRAKFLRNYAIAVDKVKA